eukprot:237096-Pleurochrysis_carterae.AAC.1
MRVDVPCATAVKNEADAASAIAQVAAMAHSVAASAGSEAASLWPTRRLAQKDVSDVEMDAARATASKHCRESHADRSVRCTALSSTRTYENTTRGAVSKVLITRSFVRSLKYSACRDVRIAKEADNDIE